MKVSVDVESAELIELDEFPGVKAAVRSIHCDRARKWRQDALNRLHRASPKRSRGIGDVTAMTEQAELEAAAGALVKVENADEFRDMSEEAIRAAVREERFRPFFTAIRRVAEEAGRVEAESREESLGN